MAARISAVCMLCRTGRTASEISLFTARRAGPAGRNGDTVGTYICADLACSAHVRVTKATATLTPDPGLSVEQRIANLITRTGGFLTEVRRSVTGPRDHERQAGTRRPVFTGVSGSSFLPVGPIWISVSMLGHTPQSKHGVQRQSSCSNSETESCQSFHSQSLSRPESRWSHGRTSSSSRSRVVYQSRSTPKRGQHRRGRVHPALVGEVLGPAVEPAAVLPRPGG